MQFVEIVEIKAWLKFYFWVVSLLFVLAQSIEYNTYGTNLA